jgi:hypothetical protein
MTYKGIASIILCIASIVLIRQGYLLWMETWLRGAQGGVQGGENIQLIRIAHAMGLLFAWLGVLGIWLATPSKKIFGDKSSNS